MSISSKEEDQILIGNVLGGDNKSFDILVEKYTSRVRSIVSGYVYNAVDIDDVSQEVFIVVFRNLKQFRGDSSFYTWLYRVTSNVAKSYLKKKKSRIPDAIIDDSEETNITLSHDHTPEKISIGREALSIVNTEIGKLPPEMKNALVARCKQGLSYNHIAEIGDCPSGTAKTRVFRARKALQQKLKQKENS